jgi:hypothetical protein
MVAFLPICTQRVLFYRTDMSNFLMLLIAAAGTSSLCACTNMQQAHVQPFGPTIVVQPPKRDAGDFLICKDGRVLVFTDSHPKTCA